MTGFAIAALALSACARPPAATPREPEPQPPEAEGPLGEPAPSPPVRPAEPPAVEDEPTDTVAAAPEPADEEVEAASTNVAPELPATRVRERRRNLEIRDDALLPSRRIVAFYGNPASRRMGILGELPPEQMLARLDKEVARWREADPATPVTPALHMIAVMATGDPGADGNYRLRLPDHQIRKVMEWAERREALVFLDIQPGQSSVRAELPHLEEWLRLPHVHLALDPEWTMPEGAVPGTRIGSMSVEDINFAIDFLARIVDEHDLPPKVLVVHRFTQGMIRNAGRTAADPRVQVVVNMDGWGPPPQKIHAYRDIVEPEATQFLGFKLFFHNDRRGASRLLNPSEIMRLDPPPAYIQYQ